MRHLNINIAGRNNPNAQQAPLPNTNPGQPNQPGPNVPTGMTSDDWKRLIKSIIISTIVFWLTFLLLHSLAPNWIFWVVVLLSFMVSILVLAAIDAAVVYKSGLGVAIVLFIIIQAIVVLIGHYGRQSKSDSENTGSVVYDSESCTINNGEEWFPDHVFQSGDSIIYIIEYGAVYNTKDDGSEVMLQPGTYPGVMSAYGVPAFKGAGEIAKVTVKYHK